MKTQFLLASLFACSLLLTMGAINYQPARPPLAGATPSFFAQAASLDETLQNMAPEELLARAIQNLDPSKVSWLRLKIWQKQACDGSCFEAEGRLSRGPNRCARLEMTISARAKPFSVIVVSDGIGLAHACGLAGKARQVETQRFLAADECPMTDGAIDQLLNAHGCGGPYWLLKDVQATVKELQIAAGAWKQASVYRLSGKVGEETKSHADMPLSARPRTCHLYIDAKTLWPHRVEWWPAGATEPILQVEFRDPQIDQPLADEECAREFSFLPE